VLILRALLTYRPTTRVDGRCLLRALLTKWLTSELDVAMTRGRGIEKRRQSVGDARLGKSTDLPRRRRGHVTKTAAAMAAVNGQSELIKQDSDRYVHQGSPCTESWTDPSCIKDPVLTTLQQRHLSRRRLSRRSSSLSMVLEIHASPRSNHGCKRGRSGKQ
jgi:hypothetical protein